MDRSVDDAEVIEILREALKHADMETTTGARACASPWHPLLGSLSGLRSSQAAEALRGAAVPMHCTQIGYALTCVRRASVAEQT